MGDVGVIPAVVDRAVHTSESRSVNQGAPWGLKMVTEPAGRGMPSPAARGRAVMVRPQQTSPRTLPARLMQRPAISDEQWWAYVRTTIRKVTR